ncbi:hypothetical protein NN561_001556 [Cricetulus griseus]
MAELDQVSFRSGRRVAPFKSCPDISVASGSDTGCIETGGGNFEYFNFGMCTMTSDIYEMELWLWLLQVTSNTTQ